MLLLFLTGLQLAFGVVLSQKCTLPQLDKDIDWGRLERTFWYEPLHASEDAWFKCKVQTDIQATSTGFKTRFGEEFRLATAPLYEFYRVARAKYVVKEKLASEIIAYAVKVGLENDKSPDDVTQMVLEDLGVANEVIMYYTDYESLLIGLACDGDKKFVFAKTKTPKITAQGVTDVHNILVDIGWSDVKLKLEEHCIGEDNKPAL